MQDFEFVDGMFEGNFEINQISFENVSSNFEKEFKSKYQDSLRMMADNQDPLTNASGASALGILEKIARQINIYDHNADFEDIFDAELTENEPYAET